MWKTSTYSSVSTAVQPEIAGTLHSIRGWAHSYKLQILLQSSKGEYVRDEEFSPYFSSNCISFVDIHSDDLAGFTGLDRF